MDSITQAALGATVQGAGMGRYQGRRALLYGALLGTLPDLDVFIRYSDPVSGMTYHRGFSHSIFLLLALAALIAWAVKKRYPDAPYSGMRLFWVTAASLVTHPLIDACTVYGTQLFWPFTPTPAQWSAVFIIDPLYTLPMLFAIAAVLWRGMRAHKTLVWALLWGSAYLAFGLYGRYFHENRVREALLAQGIAVYKVMATPTPFNTVLFRVVAQTDNGGYLETMSGWFDRDAPVFRREDQGLHYAQALAAHPLYQRLHWFTDGWLRIDEEDGKLVVSDMRMGMTGAFTFRFVMAERQDGQWRMITPYAYGRRYPDMSQAMGQLWQRILNKPVGAEENTLPKIY